MMMTQLIRDLGGDVVGPIRLGVDEALRCARSMRMGAAVLDVNVAATIVYPLADSGEEEPQADHLQRT